MEYTSFFEELVPAAGFVNRVKSKLLAGGWEEVDTFHKYVIINDYDAQGFCYVLARHIIVRNSRGDCFGIATVRVGENYNGVLIPSKQRLLNDDPKAVSVLDSLRNEKEDNYRFYVYQLDRYWTQLGLKNKVHSIKYIVPRIDDDENEDYGCGKEVNLMGGIGVKVSNYYMGAVKKRIIIEYDMYSVPDRIDVFYNGQLVATTKDKDGSNNHPDFGFVQPYVDYDDVTSDPYIDFDKRIKEGEGFVSYQGTLEFIYDPVGGNEEITVMAIGGTMNTGWTYKIDCEVIEEEESVGEYEEEEGLNITCNDVEKMVQLSLDVEHTYVKEEVLSEYG